MEPTRRGFLLAGVSLPVLSGCASEARVEVDPEGLPLVPVDIHNHVFNGRDIPLEGFLRQVVLRTHKGEPATDDPSLLSALIVLIIDIVLSVGGTPTAAQELQRLEREGGLRQGDPSRLLQQDRRAVEGGLRILEAKAQRSAEARGRARSRPGLTRSLAAPDGDERLFARLARETAVDRNTLRSLEAPGAAAPRRGDRAARIAARIYRTKEGSAAPDFTRLAKSDSPDQSFSQLLRWAGLLTRRRVDILGELLRLYGPGQGGKEAGIEVFSPSLVDFSFWLGADAARDLDRTNRDILAQMKLMSALALREERALILPFAPFCPLRAAIYRRAGRGDWLDRLKEAVERDGFAGIKLYPPMGFLPFGNAARFDRGRQLPLALRRTGITGAQLDRELAALFDWCAAEEVPIKAHGNNSLGADACAGQNAAASNWRLVLGTPRWRNLRLNIAHYGGFEEERTPPARGCPLPPGSYESQATDLIMAFDHVYVDLGYWTDVTGSNRGGGAEVLKKLAVELARTDRLAGRIMYGSDWSMIGREAGHGGYFADLRLALADPRLGLSRAQIGAILGPNALRYLGLDRRGKQFARLSRAFGGRPQFQRVIERINPVSNLVAGLRGLLTSP